MRVLCLTAALIALAPSFAIAQASDRWRYINDDPDEGPLRVTYGSGAEDDTRIAVTCLLDEDGAPFMEARFFLRVGDIPVGDRAQLNFFGPLWLSWYVATVEVSGPFGAVSRTIDFSEDDLGNRSLLNNIEEVNYRVGDIFEPEVADFSQGRPNILAFMEDCEDNDGPPPTAAVSEPEL